MQAYVVLNAVDNRPTILFNDGTPLQRFVEVEFFKKILTVLETFPALPEEESDAMVAKLISGPSIFVELEFGRLRSDGNIDTAVKIGLPEIITLSAAEIIAKAKGAKKTNEGT